jgi:hypothetical protein
VAHQKGWTVARPDQYPLFETTISRRGRAWRWVVSSTEGKILMLGTEGSRPAAKYQAHRALFLLLSAAPYRSIRQEASKAIE